MFSGSLFKKIKKPLLLLLVMVCIGTFGFMILDPRYSFDDALYMTVTTISTVGFREVHMPSLAMQYFIMFLIVSGFATFAYTISSVTSYFLSDEFRSTYRSKTIMNSINKISGHVIICGFGRNGRQAAHVLKKHDRRFVVIEQKKDLTDELTHKFSHLVLNGDATQDETLEQAGIARAAAIITTLPTDADNLFIVLTARSLNPNLIIISRASDDSSDKKLKTAGANNVIMPDKIGGAHMASLVLKPDVIEFVDHITGQGGPDINLEEITFENLPEHLRNKTIRDLEIRNKSGANIVGFKTAAGDFIINPNADTQLIPEGKLFVLGTPEQILALKALLN